MGIWARLEKTGETSAAVVFRSVRGFNILGVYLMLGGAVIAAMLFAFTWVLSAMLASPHLLDRLIVYGAFAGMAGFFLVGAIFSLYDKRIEVDRGRRALSIDSRVASLPFRRLNLEFTAVDGIVLENRNRWKEAPDTAIAKSGYWEIRLRIRNRPRPIYVDRSGSRREVENLADVLGREMNVSVEVVA